MKFLKENSEHPEWYPQVFCQEEIDEINVGGDYYDDVCKVICYEYLEETDEIETARKLSDIEEQLNDMHNLGIIHGDVRNDNIIASGRFLLIDYGRSFSIDHTPFPPMEFMVDEDDFPTIDTDNESLQRI